MFDVVDDLEFVGQGFADTGEIDVLLDHLVGEDVVGWNREFAGDDLDRAEIGRASCRERVYTKV